MTRSDRDKPNPAGEPGASESGVESFLFRALGVVLLLVPFVPLAALFGAFPDSDRVVSPREWLLGTAIFLVLGWLLTLGRIPEWIEKAGGQLTETSKRWVPAASLGVLALLLTMVWWSLFRWGPLLVDSMVQLFQARVFASGRLTAAAPPSRGSFMIQNMLMDHGRWFGQYPPGHSALLVPGVLAGVPWLVPILLSIVAAAALYAFTRRAYDAATARLTLVLLALCPFFWFMGASYMSHVSTLCFVALFLWGFVVWEAEGGAGRAAVTGLVLGVAFLSRPLTALAVGLPFAAVALHRVRSGGRYRDVLVGLSAFAGASCLYLLYNAATTGSALLPGYIALWGSSHGLGFHVTPWGVRHTPVTGLRNELTDLQLLAGRLFEWPIPALWPVGACLTAGWLRNKWDRRLAVAFLALPVAYFFYWHRDSYLGPRYLYAGVAFIIPLTARAFVDGYRRLATRSFQLGALFRPVDGGRFAVTVAALCFLWAAVAGIPGRWRSYLGEYGEVQDHLAEQARVAGIGRGLVFVKVDAGNRLLAGLRGLGASASLVEKAYRAVDFCELVQTERAARGRGWSSARLEAALRAGIGRHEILVRAPRLNGDPSLRLRRGRLDGSLHLPPACADELRYDHDGYDLYTPHLLDNRPDLSGPLVVARDLRGLNGSLEKRFPDRPAYLYEDGHFTRLPTTGDPGP